METAANENTNNWADGEELKRFCTVFGVMQSNMLYRILSAGDKAEMMELIRQESENLQLSSRGGEKCPDGKVWDEVRKECV